MSRLPTPGGDAGTWASILNDYLARSHAADGTLAANLVIGGDTTLYRSAAATLTTDGTLIAKASIYGGSGAAAGAINSFTAQVAGDAFGRWRVTNDGKMWFGSGAANADATLYRSAAATLATDSLIIKGFLGFGPTAMNGGPPSGSVSTKIIVTNDAGAYVGVIPVWSQ